MSSSWILIPNHNGLRWLPKCLASLYESIPATTPVLVVDNASTDGSLAYLADHFPLVRVLPLEWNLGFVQAMDLAILAARTGGADRVVLLNNDTRLSADWYVTLTSVADRSPNHGILGPIQKDFHGAPSLRSQAIVNRWSRGKHHSLALPEVIDTDWVEGSCMLIAGWVFDRIGYLDPLYAPAYFEELDFCRRARWHGIRVGLVTTTAIEHYGAGSSLARARRGWHRRLTERNYLLYHAAAPELAPGSVLSTLVRRAVWHGSKSVLAGKLRFSDWLAALTALPRHFAGLGAKVRRDRDKRPCPILGDQLPDSPQLRYFADCATRIERGEMQGVGRRRRQAAERTN